MESELLQEKTLFWCDLPFYLGVQGSAIHVYMWLSIHSLTWVPCCGGVAGQSYVGVSRLNEVFSTHG